MKIRMIKDAEKNMKTVRLPNTLTFTYELAIRPGMSSFKYHVFKPRQRK